MHEQVTTLLGAGHVHAQAYPVWMVNFEAYLVVRRENAVEARRAVLLQQAVASLLDKKDRARFKETIEKLNG